MAQIVSHGLEPFYLNISGVHLCIDLARWPGDNDAANLKDGLQADVLQLVPQGFIRQNKLNSSIRIAKNDKLLHPVYSKVCYCFILF